MEGAWRTLPHEYEGYRRVGCTVKPVVVKKFFIHRSNTRENRQPCFSPFVIRIYSSRILSSSLFFFFFFVLIPWNRWEKQEKHMGLQIMLFGLQEFLATEAQFWTFPPPSRLLYLQWWVWNSMTANRSWLSPWPIIPWENLGHHLPFLPTSCPICK